MKSSLLVIAVLLTTLPLLSGCRDDDPCANDPDSKHCYQQEAMDASDPGLCNKISGKEFKQYGSNPPRDKCYMMVAAKMGDYSICNKIK